ncbi:ATP-binding protein [Paraflavisolibacter caeni]|uniref:ATP-binding protein n=1 Tax=Paraflavisolibacter caeni TaxID=2982496 RepID=UPI003C6E0F31
MLFNLLSNAYKYTHDHGAINVRLEYLSGQDIEGRLAIYVSDTGIGIAKDQQDRIFERFFQSDVPESMENQRISESVN